jgi:hypothetical protein
LYGKQAGAAMSAVIAAINERSMARRSRHPEVSEALQNGRIELEDESYDWVHGSGKHHQQLSFCNMTRNKRI